MRPLRRYLAPALGVVLLGPLALELTRLGLADHWAESDPERALALHADQPEARAAAADALLSADPAAAAAAAAAAFAANPAEAGPLRTLAAARAAQGDDAGAEALMLRAVALAPRDIPAQSWLAGRDLAAARFDSALERIDTVLRVEPQLSGQWFPALLLLAPEPAARAALLARLASAPPWRKSWWLRLCRDGEDLDAIDALYRGLRASAAPPDADEARAWTERLVRSGRWYRAYPVWVENLAEADRLALTNVVDGGFEREPEQSGFGWRFDHVPGAEVRREADEPGHGRALRVDFEERRVPFHHVRQLLMLTPGHYRLSGRVRPDGLRSERGLQWSVTCPEPPSPRLAESERFQGRGPWRAFATDFDVPAGCGVQWLTLAIAARIPAETQIGGTIWFDDLAIERIPADAPPPTPAPPPEP